MATRQKKRTHWGGKYVDEGDVVFQQLLIPAQGLIASADWQRTGCRMAGPPLFQSGAPWVCTLN